MSRIWLNAHHDSIKPTFTAPGLGLKIFRLYRQLQSIQPYNAPVSSIVARKSLTTQSYIVKLRYMSNQVTLIPEKQRLAKMLKALGNPVRFQIVEFLAENQMCITNDIVRNTPLAQSTVSQHLKVLKEAGLISRRNRGPGHLLLSRSRELPMAQGANRQLAANKVLLSLRRSRRFFRRELS